MKYVNHKGSTVEINGVDSQLKMACDAENAGFVELSQRHLALALFNEKHYGEMEWITNTDNL